MEMMSAVPQYRAITMDRDFKKIDSSNRRSYEERKKQTVINERMMSYVRPPDMEVASVATSLSLDFADGVGESGELARGSARAVLSSRSLDRGREMYDRTDAKSGASRSFEECEIAAAGGLGGRIGVCDEMT